jgi:hypothetical protein
MCRIHEADELGQILDDTFHVEQWQFPILILDYPHAVDPTDIDAALYKDLL